MHVKPIGTFYNALANPDLLPTRMGKPADKASSATRPNPSDFDGMMARSTSHNKSLSLSLHYTNFLTVNRASAIPR